MTAAIETTTFRLVGRTTLAAFVAANADIDEWLKRQPGFRSRRIAQRDDGVIVDTLLWNSEAEGTSAMHRIMDEMGHSPVHALIDQGTVSWSIAPVRGPHTAER